MDTWKQTMPRDDAWKQVTAASVAALGQGLWLRCDCGHELIVDALAFADRHKLGHDTPLLRIGEALRCSRCGEKKAHCRPEPYSSTLRRT